MSLALAQQHKKDLDILTQASYVELFDFLEVISDLSVEDWAKLVKESVPELTRKYGPNAALIASNYYDNSRQTAQDFVREVYNEYSASATLYNQVALDNQIVGAAGYSINQRKAGAWSLTQATDFLYGAVQQNLNNYSNSTIQNNATEDEAAVSYARIPQPNACDWCKYMAVVVDGGKARDSGIAVESEDLEGFHKHCRCVIGVTFKTENERKFRQAFYGNYEQSFDEAYKKINDGEAFDDRTLRIGTQDYESALKNKLRGLSKSWVNNKASDLDWSKAEISRRNKETLSQAKGLAHKLTYNQELTDTERKVLDAWNFDSKEKQEFKKPITALTTRNILYVMNHS